MDYQKSLNLVLHAQSQFDALPAHTRARFANDPKMFLEFTSNPENIEEMIKLGLAKERPLDSKEPVKTGSKEEAKASE